MKRFLDARRGGLRRRNGGHVRDLVLDRHHPDAAVVDLAETADGSVDDQFDLTVLDQVGHVRTALVELLHRGVRDAVRFKERRGPFGRNQLEAELMQRLHDRQQVLALALRHGDQHRALERQPRTAACCDLK